MTFLTKRLARSDMKTAARVHRASFDKRLPWLAGLHTPDEDRAFFQDVVYDRSEVWGSFDGKHLLAYIAFHERRIEHLYVLPSYQFQGLGTLLLSLAQVRCAELDLWTFQRNTPARRFYERKGFVAIETTDGSRNEENEPDVRYFWRRR